MDLPKYYGMCEFSVIPLSLFPPDGSLYFPKDKATITTEFRNLQVAKENESIEEFSSNNRKVIAVAGMAIVKND